ncbi:MAG: hypothetical protein NVSMB45_05100 [Ginsengibacter sp.]
MQKLIEGKDLSVYYEMLPDHLDEEVLNINVGLLPLAISSIINKYKDLNSRWLRVKGKILLKQLLLDMHLVELSSLNSISYSKENKTFLSSEVDFSISHCKNAVICAVTRTGTIGVDIECIIPVNTKEFEDHFTIKELEMIENDTKSFFKLWTKKEALAKATGLGVFFDFKNHEVIKNEITYDNLKYQFEELHLNHETVCFICKSEN